ncbi:DUF3793 family protein [Treponema sp. UBA3813]|uniref:DUF3793 family protein n=1 Tax=Treponema sp. UBA3813 TaxID=1947715 RepID=UPI0025CD7C59|nr:DUF3793 family protein [Treponema sp. UBA3813]
MSFDETIIHCSAPALCGIKPANLFSMDAESFMKGRKKLLKWQGDFCKSKRYFVPLKKDDSRFLFFVYDRELLEKIISCAENIRYLESKGYSFEKGLNGILCELLHRLMYKSCSETCMKWLDEGLSVPVVAKKYSNQKKGA